MGWMQTRSLYSNTCGSFVMKAFDYGFEICNGNLLARIGSGTNWNTYAMRTLSSADLNVWKHVAMTFNGTTVRLFLDGVEVNSATGTHGSNNNPLLFGRWTPASEYWNGLIDEVRLYSRALSASEVQTDMNAPVSGGSTNQAPSATLTAPANGASFTAPATVALTATASDSDGSVARVDFYNGSSLLGSDTTAPYAFTWSNVAAGTYALRATAVDNAGASGSSAVATITVGAANQAANGHADVSGERGDVHGASEHHVDRQCGGHQRHGRTRRLLQRQHPARQRHHGALRVHVVERRGRHVFAEGDGRRQRRRHGLVCDRNRDGDRRRDAAADVSGVPVVH